MTTGLLENFPRVPLAKTPLERICAPDGTPYFLWDCDLTLDAFRRLLEDPDPAVRGHFVGKLMRQAKPDDVFHFVTPAQIADLWSEIVRYLGRERDFWTWLLRGWGYEVDGRWPPDAAR